MLRAKVRYRRIGASAVTSTQLGYLSGVTSDIQTQLTAVNTAVASAAKYIITGLSCTTNSNILAGINLTPYFKNSCAKIIMWYNDKNAANHKYIIFIIKKMVQII